VRECGEVAVQLGRHAILCAGICVQGIGRAARVRLGVLGAEHGFELTRKEDHGFTNRARASLRRESVRARCKAGRNLLRGASDAEDADVVEDARVLHIEREL
jgi:hypothetical protein